MQTSESNSQHLNPPAQISPNPKILLNLMQNRLK